MDHLANEIRDYVVEYFLFGCGRDAITNETSLMEEGIVDSSGVMELVAFLESNYGIEVDDSELLPRNLESPRRIASYVRRKMRGNAPQPSHAPSPALAGASPAYSAW